MREIEIEVTLEDGTAELYANGVFTPETELSAGMDLRATKGGSIEPGETYVVGTGIRLAITPGYCMKVLPRSGLSLRGVTVGNSPGLIDADYRGEVGVVLHNRGREAFSWARGDRIAQCLFMEHVRPKVTLVETLPQTQRGAGGFGSTGT